MTAQLDQLEKKLRSQQAATAARDDYLGILAEIARQQLPCTISVKLTQLGLDISETECRANLKGLLESAKQTGTRVEVDMEGSAYTARTLALIRELRQSNIPVVAVIQAYLYRSENDVQQLLLQGTSIRLCKGAYREPPTVAFPRKSDVDRNFARLMRLLLASRLYHKIATHDPRLIEEPRRHARQLGLPKEGFEFQMLYGVRGNLQRRLVQEGYRLRIYVPFGAEWFPYFMRRLAERPANVWFAMKNLLR